MFRLSIKKYSFILFFQACFMCFDLFANSFTYVLARTKMAVILLFLAQDACLVLSVAGLLYSIYSTFLYQAGVTQLLYKKFKFSIITSLIYLALSVTLHFLIFADYNSATSSFFHWTKAVTTLFFIHRLFSPIYYYLYKRATLKISDPRFYENLEWLNESWKANHH